MSALQLIRSSDVRTTAGGAGVDGRVGVFYQDEATGQIYVWNPQTRTMQALPQFRNDGVMLGPLGATTALYEPWTVATLTDTGNAATAACEYGGVKVRAVSSTVNLVLYDATSATGTVIDTISGLSLTGGPNGNGYYPWSSLNAGRVNSTGLHVVFSGGGTATVDVLRRLI